MPDDAIPAASCRTGERYLSPRGVSMTCVGPTENEHNDLEWRPEMRFQDDSGAYHTFNLQLWLSPDTDTDTDTDGDGGRQGKTTLELCIGGKRSLVEANVASLTVDEVMELGTRDNRMWMQALVSQEMDRRGYNHGPATATTATTTATPTATDTSDAGDDDGSGTEPAATATTTTAMEYFSKGQTWFMRHRPAVTGIVVQTLHRTGYEAWVETASRHDGLEYPFPIDDGPGRGRHTLANSAEWERLVDGSTTTATASEDGSTVEGAVPPEQQPGSGVPAASSGTPDPGIHCDDLRTSLANTPAATDRAELIKKCDDVEALRQLLDDDCDVKLQSVVTREVERQINWLQKVSDADGDPKRLQQIQMTKYAQSRPGVLAMTYRALEAARAELLDDHINVEFQSEAGPRLVPNSTQNDPPPPNSTQDTPDPVVSLVPKPAQETGKTAPEQPHQRLAKTLMPGIDVRMRKFTPVPGDGEPGWIARVAEEGPPENWVGPTGTGHNPSQAIMALHEALKKQVERELAEIARVPFKEKVLDHEPTVDAPIEVIEGPATTIDPLQAIIAIMQNLPKSKAVEIKLKLERVGDLSQAKLSIKTSGRL